MEFDGLFNPSGIAIIGASRDPSKVGSAVLKNIRITYKGDIYPINPFVDQIQGIRAFKSISLVKEPIDLAIIAIPAEKVLDELKKCEKKHIKFAIIISAGFKESGHTGAHLEEDIRNFLNKAKIRVIGPNCLGVINVNLPYNSTFMDPNSKPIEGRTAFISQSGALLSAVVDDATMSKIGFSKIISVGNAVDITEADLLRHLATDEMTDAIAMYIEEVNDGKDFLDALTEASKKKPVIILKGGRFSETSSAVSSHTGSIAGSNRAYELAFRRGGAITVYNIDDLYNFIRDAPSLSINGDEVVILTNAGGAGVVATDSLASVGLKLAKLPEKLSSDLRKSFPKGINSNNPVDILGDATPERYREALSMLLRVNKPIIAIFAPQEMAMPIETAKGIIEAHNSHPEIPLLPVFMGGASVEKGEKLLLENKLPCYRYPNEAVDVVKGLVFHKRFIEPKYTQSNRVKIKVSKLKSQENLFGLHAKEIFDKLGIRTVKGVKFKDQKELRAASGVIGFPCVMKIGSDSISHKGEVGGILTGIKDLQQLEREFEDMSKKMRTESIKVPYYELYEDANKYSKDSYEIILGGHRDEKFGPIVGLGIGGEYVKIINEMRFALSPVSDYDIEKIKESKAGKIVKALCKETVLNEIVTYLIKIAKLMDENPWIKDIDINPLLVSENGAIAVDFKIYS